MSNSEINCILCSKDFQINDLITIGKCSHLICRKCLVEYVTQNLKVNINCSVDNCSKSISDRTIRKCLSNDQITIFDQLSVTTACLKIKSCPIKECPFMYITEDNIGIFDCGFCESPICIKCNDIHYPQDCGKLNIEKIENNKNEKVKSHLQIMICVFAVLICWVPFITNNLWYLVAWFAFLVLLVGIVFKFNEVLKCLGNLIDDDLVNKDTTVANHISSQKIEFQSRAIERIKKKRREELVEMDVLYDLLPNPSPYECTFCTDFILPREGVILRNCLHCFCRNCLKDAYSMKNYTHQLKCQICNVKLQDKELRVLIEEKRFVSMIINEVSCVMYHCKNENCDGICDVTTGTTSFPCPICASVNCIECNDIHRDMSCEEFKRTKKYVDSVKEMEVLKSQIHINCCYCKSVLIQKGGCGALYCETCGNHICIFTGLFAGNHDSKKCGCWAVGNCTREGKYCECNVKKPCHAKCQYGCFPD